MPYVWIKAQNEKEQFSQTKLIIAGTSAANLGITKRDHLLKGGNKLYELFKN